MCLAGPAARVDEAEDVWVEDEGRSVLVNKALLYSGGRKEKLVPTVTYEQVQATAKEEDKLWIIIDTKVYDVKRFARFHPGGDQILTLNAGKDMTDAFMQFHQRKVYKRLGAMHVANMDPAYVEQREAHPLTKAWRKLNQDVLAEGLYQTNYWYYVREMGKNLAWLALSVLLYTQYISTGNATWDCVLGSVFFGVYLQQNAFIGHDVGHMAVTHNKEKDSMIGIVVGNLMTGLGMGWWKYSHNTHHIMCNSIDADPDIQHMPFLACNPEILKKRFMSSYRRVIFDFATDSAARFFIKHQKFLMYPILFCFARYNMYVESFKMIFEGRSSMPKTEVLMLLAFWTWYLGMLKATQHTWPMVALAVFVSHSVSGMLNLQITLSHFAMTVYYGTAYNEYDHGIEDGWVFTQLKTTLAIECSPWVDFFHGGLQFQDVHHLMPRVPRHNLRLLRPRIRKLVKDFNIPCPAMSFEEANRMVYKGFVDTANAARSYNRKQTRECVNNLMIWDGLKSVG